MTIPKSYEALAADLASEKILSKTLVGQKEAYMMLADQYKVDLDEAMARNYALERKNANQCESIREYQDIEAALLEELELQKNHFKIQLQGAKDADMLQQRLAVAEQRESEAREELLDLSRKLDVFYSRSHGIKNLSAIEDANDKSKALQQRLTVAEQRAAVMEKALSRIAREHDCGCSPCTGSCTSQVALEITVDAMRDIAIAALKPAEGEVS